MRERLDSDEPVGPAEAARLRAKLRRFGDIGNRLAHRANTLGWRDAIRNERRWLVTAVALATALPLIGTGLIIARTIRGDLQTDALPDAGEFLAVSVAAVAGAIMRRVRHRRNLHDLGMELRAQSTGLLDRLTMAAPIQPSRPTSTLRALWGRLVRGRPR